MSGPRSDQHHEPDGSCSTEIAYRLGSLDSRRGRPETWDFYDALHQGRAKATVRPSSSRTTYLPVHRRIESALPALRHRQLLVLSQRVS